MQTDDDLHFSVECNINGKLKQVKGKTPSNYKMVTYSDIEVFEIRNPKVFLGFVVGSVIFLLGVLCKEQFMDTNHLFST